MHPTPDDGYDDEGTLDVEPHHFAIVPEWIIYAEISDAAYRLYSILLRQGQSSGRRMPTRATLARLLRKRSTDTVDRAIKELVALGAVRVETIRRGREYTRNRYYLRTSPPPAQPPAPATSSPDAAEKPHESQSRRSGSGRKFAATAEDGLSGRIDAATLAANLRPNPVVPTQENFPPPSSQAADDVVAPMRRRRSSPAPVADAAELCRTLGIDSLETLAARCREIRRGLGKPAGLWTATAIGQMLHRSIHVDGWPVVAAVPALLAVTAAPATNSPGRLPCAGPWWTAAEQAAGATTTAAERAELVELEARLAEVDGYRVSAQRLAREQLVAEGQPVTRLTVARRAVEILASRGVGA